MPLQDANATPSFGGFRIKKMNAEPESLPALTKQFRTTLRNNLQLFDKHAFRKHEPGQKQRNVINASLWDVMSTGLSRYPALTVKKCSAALREGFYRLLEHEDFHHSITYGTSGVKQVICRFEMAEAMFEDVFGAYPA